MKKKFNDYLIEMEEIQNNENEIHYEFANVFFGIALLGAGVIFTSFILILIYAYFYDRKNKKENKLINEIKNLASTDQKFKIIWEKIEEKIKELENEKPLPGTVLKDYSIIMNAIKKDSQLLKKIEACYENEVFKEKWKKLIDNTKNKIKNGLEKILPKNIIKLLWKEQ